MSDVVLGDGTPVLVLVAPVGAPGADGPAGVSTLAALTDVDATGVADGQVLAFDGESGTWLPVSSAGGLSPEQTEQLEALGARNAPGGYPGLTADGLVIESQIPGSITRDSEVAELARDAIGSALVAGDGISIDVDDTAETITLSADGAGLTPDQEEQLDALALTDGRLSDAVMPPEVVAVTGVVRATGALTNGPPSPMDGFVSGNGMTPTAFDASSTLSLPGTTLVAPAGDHSGLGFVASIAAPAGPDGATPLGATVRGATFTGETATVMLFLTDATDDVLASVPFSGEDQTVDLDASDAVPVALTVVAFGQVDADVVLGSIEWTFSTPIDAVDSRIDGLTADDIAYSGTGLFGGTSGVDNALNRNEGTLDRWRFVSAFSTTNVDLSGLVGVSSVAEQPTLDGAAVPALGADVWLFAQTDPAENGCYEVLADTGVWRKWNHPDVFYPPGNGYRVTCNAAGTDVDGTTFVWLDNDRTRFHRVSASGVAGFPYGASDTGGRWVRWADPAAVIEAPYVGGA